MSIVENFKNLEMTETREIVIEYKQDYPVMWIHSSLKDDYHFFHVYWKIDIDTSEVIEMEGILDEQPFTDCTGALNIFDNMRGLKIWKGVKKEFINRFKKPEGCTHLTEIAFATFDFVMSRLHGPTSRPMDEVQKNQLRCNLAKMICDGNGCIIYNKDNWKHFDERGAYKGKNYLE